MEKKLTKNEKGITLVALIITIIILLILAVVSIRAITGDSILEKAEVGKNKYEEAKVEEEGKLNEYSDAMDIYAENSKGELKGTIDYKNSDGDTITLDFNNMSGSLMGEETSNLVTDGKTYTISGKETFPNATYKLFGMKGKNGYVILVNENYCIFLGEFAQNEDEIKDLIDQGESDNKENKITTDSNVFVRQ